jgi:hypothetical protein
MGRLQSLRPPPPLPTIGAWYHAGYHLATTIATPAAYAPIPFAFSYLGWAGGLASLIIGAAVTYYNSIILASLHRYNGTRHKRYADLGQDVFGGRPGPATDWHSRHSGLLAVNKKIAAAEHQLAYYICLQAPGATGP